MQIRDFPTAMIGSTQRGIVLASILTLALAACSGSGTTGEGETRDVEDVLGVTSVPVEPQRIVADSVDTYAVLASLGVEPVGVAMPESVSPEYIGDDAGQVTNLVADDGWTVNVEEALAHDADLIVAVGADYNQDNCTRYKEAIATYCYVDLWEDEEAIKQKVRNIAAAIGREAEAEEVIAAYEKRAEDFKTRLAEADLDGLLAGIVRFDSGGFIGVRTADLPNALLAGLGLGEPEWPEVGESGYVELSMETLDVLNAADILFVTTDDDVVMDEMEVFSSPFWLELEPVVDGQAHFVSAWNGYDLLQLTRVIEDVEQALLG